jgi:hypothetical protein
MASTVYFESFSYWFFSLINNITFNHFSANKANLIFNIKASFQNEVRLITCISEWIDFLKLCLQKEHNHWNEEEISFLSLIMLLKMVIEILNIMVQFLFSRYSNECVVRNLLLAPMPWELLSVGLRKRYGLMWFWMKQTTVERLRVRNDNCMISKCRRGSGKSKTLNNTHASGFTL